MRKTCVAVYEPNEGEVASIYEMGIPVVETGDKFLVNVMQKVPLSLDRDNVTPSYLRTIRTLVPNATAHLLDPDDTVTAWVDEATSDRRCESEVVKQIMIKRFGEKTVAYDPSDPEANKIAMSKGYTVIAGRTLTKGQWENVKMVGVARPAGQVTPSPKPFSPEGEKPPKTLPLEKWTLEMHRFEEYATEAAKAVLGNDIQVVIVNDPTWPFSGAFGADGILYVNLVRNGYEFF